MNETTLNWTVVEGKGNRWYVGYEFDDAWTPLGAVFSIKVDAERVAALLNGERVNGGPSRMALMRRNGELRAEKPIAWVSEDGLHNIRTARERGISHYTVQVRIDRRDDYNTAPLYLKGSDDIDR